MMDILENELVRKYFWQEGITQPLMAFDVLRAMQEPIRKGDLYLLSNKCEVVVEHDGRINYSTWHPVALRLPDRFQTAGKLSCDYGCHGDLVSRSCRLHNPQPPPDKWKITDFKHSDTCWCSKPK